MTSNDNKITATKSNIFSSEVLSLIKRPAKINFNPSEKYYQNYRYFAMQASVEVTKKGRLWSCWIGGEDGSGAYLIATYSDDGGETFKDIQLVIDPHDESLPMIMNTHIGCLWQDPKGRLWLFYQQSFGMWDGEGANYAIVCSNPDDEYPKWSEPKYVSFGASLKKPIITSKGEWVLPVSIWERWHISAPLTHCHEEMDYMRGARFFVSNDEGESWTYRGGIDFKDSQFNEHSVVELDGERLMVYSRCAQAIKKSYSYDFGATWSEEEVAFPHVGSLAMIRTLPSGNIVLIKHGESFTEATPDRRDLTAFISKDGGRTYEGGLLLDEREGVSYPDIAIGKDGEIIVQYDYHRTTDAQILFARFTEEDVLAGEFKSDRSGTKFIIKDTDGIKGHPAHFPKVAEFLGEGTEQSPYEIDCAEKWNALAKKVIGGESFAGKYFRQTANIDFGGANIQPVGFWLQGGSHKLPFMGNYDGGGFAIANFKQDAPELYCRALFGYVLDGTVKNVTVKNALFRGRTNTASIVGYALGKDAKVEVSSCANYDVSIYCYEQVGGIVGRAEGVVAVKNCKNGAKVTVPYSSEGRTIYAGGIAGYTASEVTIENCFNSGVITVKNGSRVVAGAICACENERDLSSSKNEGEVFVIDSVGEAI